MIPRPQPTHILRWPVLLALSLWLGGPLWGQMSLQPQDSQIWDGVRLITVQRSLNGPFAGLIQEKDGSTALQLPSPGRREGWSVGQIHVCEGRFFHARFRKGPVVTPEGSFFEHEVQVWEDRVWKPFASARLPGLATALFPLGEDRFLATAISPATFVEDKKPFPFAVLRRNDQQELIIEQRMDTGLKKPFFDQGGRMVYGALATSLLMGNWARTDDYLVLFSQFGQFWVFEGAKGRLRRVMHLFPGLDDKRLQEGNLYPGLLGVQPRPNGHLLVAARREDAVLLAPLSHPARAMPKGAEERTAWSDEVHRQYPHIDWWDLDPATGMIEPEIAPRGLPELLSGETAAMNFNWRFRPDGNLDLVSLRDRYPAPNPANAAGASGPKGTQGGPGKP